MGEHLSSEYNTNEPNYTQKRQHIFIFIQYKMQMSNYQQFMKFHITVPLGHKDLVFKPFSVFSPAF